MQGNHDAWASVETGPGLTAEDRRWLAGLPRIHSDGDWLAYHSHMDDVEGDDIPTWVYVLNERDIRRTFAHHDRPRVLVCGHSHIASVNVLEPDGRLTYVPPGTLKRDPRVPVAPGARYLVCAGRPDECVVIYHAGEAIEFVFRAD